jgi:hypothetical protein
MVIINFIQTCMQRPCQSSSRAPSPITVAEIHFLRWGGGAKPPKFPTKLSNFRQPPPPPPHLHSKTVFSHLLGQNWKFVNCLWRFRYMNVILNKYKIFSVLIHSYINTSGNWENEKLCGNTTPGGVFTQFRVFPNFEFSQFPRVLI